MTEKRALLYEGKAKKVFSTENPDLCIIAYKDDATAFNGLKKGSITGKGIVNNRMSNLLFAMLEGNGVKTHFVAELLERETVVKRVEIVPLEAIVRNVAAGSFAKRYGVAEGSDLACPTLEYCLKNDALADPMINEYQIRALQVATPQELQIISAMSFRVNALLKEYFRGINLELIDFKLEFGRFKGEIVLADEISPDTCRLWDLVTHEKMDKDRFRRDLGGVEEAYQEVMQRLGLK